MPREIHVIYEKCPGKDIRGYAFSTSRLCDMQELVLQSNGVKPVSVFPTDDGTYQRVSVKSLLNFCLKEGD